jgi:hypothetical protein
MHLGVSVPASCVYVQARPCFSFSLSVRCALSHGAWVQIPACALSERAHCLHVHRGGGVLPVRVGRPAVRARNIQAPLPPRAR